MWILAGISGESSQDREGVLGSTVTSAVSRSCSYAMEEQVVGAGRVSLASGGTGTVSGGWTRSTQPR